MLCMIPELALQLHYSPCQAFLLLASMMLMTHMHTGGYVTIIHVQYHFKIQNGSNHVKFTYQLGLHLSYVSRHIWFDSTT